MVYFTFGERMFKKEYRSCCIDMVIASKARFDSPYSFLEEAAEMLVTKMKRDEYCYLQDKDCYLKLGAYSQMIAHWISSLDEETEVNLDDIQHTFRVKTPGHIDPCEETYIIANQDEYILLIWSTTD